MFRAINQWLPGYLASVRRRPRAVTRPCHLMFCVADHFEPLRGGLPAAEARGVVGRWVDEYPRQAADFRDADGRPPRHTFFYPQEEYDAGCLDRLAGLCSGGYGEVEIHLHHRNDTAEGLRGKLEGFRDTLRAQHGLLGHDARGQVRFGFVHGNWALCNSRPDGDWCGVNEELGVLRSAGCYADFTFPSAPSSTQPRMVNAVYRAVDRPGRPGGCQKGVECQVSSGKCKELPGSLHSHTPILPYSLTSLMLITGPLAIDWRRRKGGVLPRLENGAITAANPPSPWRARLWARQHIHVQGRPDWVFVKVYTHGCMAENTALLLGQEMRDFHRHMGKSFNDGREWMLHYVTAREMYNIARAAEDGRTGNPGACRDYEILPPAG